MNGGTPTSVTTGPASEQNNAADPSRVLLREAEDPHVADRGADDVCSLEFECVQNALLNVGYERPGPCRPWPCAIRMISTSFFIMSSTCL